MLKLIFASPALPKNDLEVGVESLIRTSTKINDTKSNCEAQGKGRARGGPRKVTQRSLCTVVGKYDEACADCKIINPNT